MQAQASPFQSAPDLGRSGSRSVCLPHPSVQAWGHSSQGRAARPLQREGRGRRALPCGAPFPAPPERLLPVHPQSSDVPTPFQVDSLTRASMCAGPFWRFSLRRIGGSPLGIHISWPSSLPRFVPPRSAPGCPRPLVGISARAEQPDLYGVPVAPGHREGVVPQGPVAQTQVLAAVAATTSPARLC